MKQNLFFALFIGLFSHTLSLQAQDIRAGSLKIAYYGNESIQIELDGPMYFSEPFTNNILFSGLIPGNYTLKAYSTSRRNRNNLLVNKRISITSQQRTIVNIDENGQLSFHSSPDNNTVFLSPDYYGRYQQPLGRNPVINGPQPLSEREFNQLIAAIKKAPFDKDKFQVLNVSARYSLFYTDQIYEMIKLFSFDDERLNCAKILAPRAFDPQNLYTLGEAFSFLSTREKYFEYLKTNQLSRDYHY